MRTKIFTHKGILGIESSYKAEGLLNNPKAEGQLGFAIDSNYVDIQPEALRLMNQIKPGSDEDGKLSVFETDSNIFVIAWVGDAHMSFDPLKIVGCSSYDPMLLERTVDFKTPKDFVRYVEKLKTKRKHKKRIVKFKRKKFKGN